MSVLHAEIQRLVAPNLRKRLYVAFSYPVASVEETMPHIAQHTHYLVEHEDMVFLSGPFVTEAHIVGEGMTVLYAATEKEAAEIMDNEPFIRRRLRRYELKFWELREGTLSIKMHLSATRFALD
jgi:uncharacterized protein YciI